MVPWTVPARRYLVLTMLERLSIRDIFYHCNKFKYYNVKEDTDDK